MNKLSEDNKRTMILKFAENEGCEIHFGMLKKNQKDGKNFHILTPCGVLLQREEAFVFMKAEKQIIWSVVDKSGNRIKGDFGTVIHEFNKAISVTLDLPEELGLEKVESCVSCGREINKADENNIICKLCGQNEMNCGCQIV
jgi:hypothetical protein